MGRVAPFFWLTV